MTYQFKFNNITYTYEAYEAALAAHKEMIEKYPKLPYGLITKDGQPIGWAYSEKLGRWVSIPE